MKTFIEKQREAISILIYVGIVAGLFYLVVMPLIARIEDRSNQIQEESLKQESARKHLAELPNIEMQYNNLQENSAPIEVLLSNDNAVVLIEKLEKLAENTGNKITISVAQNNGVQQKVSTKEKTKADETLIGGLPSQNYLQMNIELAGKYESVRNFIRLLENFEYPGDITAIRISFLPTVASSGSGFTSSPFATSADKDVSKTAEKKENILNASLDTVFYTK